MADPKTCACEKCSRERFVNEYHAKIMDFAHPVYNAIADLIRANYDLADELFSVKRERDRLAEELDVLKDFEAIAAQEAKP